VRTLFRGSGKELAGLSPTPQAVLAWVRAKVGGGSRDGEDAIAFVTINAVLRDNLLPPAVEAAFFQALGRLSGVTLVPGAVNLDGRPAIAPSAPRSEVSAAGETHPA
jgi:hypothetical protein